MAHRPLSNSPLQEGSLSSSISRTYYNKTFEDTTDLFLFACAHGDYMLVHRLLSEGEVTADVSNKMGKSALQLAIENEHFEVVKVLLGTIPYEKFRDALLLAIYLGHTNIADFIMNHPTYRTFSGGFLDPTHPQAYDDSQFSSDITPLILAAQHNRLQIVHQLLSKGERIKKPHASMCPCIDCADSSAHDSFRQAQVRLSAYKGLSSEVYIALTYPDPILQAFELSHELRTLAKVEHYFREDYRKLANQLSIFVTRLLDNVRGHEELEIVLNKTGRPNEEEYENLARFDLAIQYQEKPFVSHSNCQQKLMEKWYEDLSAIKNAHLTKRFLFYLAFIICLPFLLIAYYLAPKTRIGSLCHQPNLKLKAYIFSYLAFISLILASSYFSISHLKRTKFLSSYDNRTYEKYIRHIYSNTELRNHLMDFNENTNRTEDYLVNCDISLRFMEPNPFQIAIFIWVIGFTWQEFKQMFGSGMRVYLTSHSNYVDCIMNVFYILYFIFLYSAMIYTRTAMNIFRSNDYWHQMARYGNMTLSEKDYYLARTHHILYWLNADRFYWNSNDAQNLAEAFFAMGNVASICRICFLLPIIGFIGPLQVMLERLIIDISKWIVIIVIFFIAFACSLFLIFSFFAVALNQQNAMRDLSSNHQPNEVGSPRNTTSMYTRCPQYFFQLIDPVQLELISSEAPYLDDDDDDDDDPNDTCSKTEDYEKIRQVGPYPAIHYFGKSFGSTVLTIFFTLFGVIAEDGIPDRGYELISLTCNKPDVSTYAPGFDLFTSNLGFVIFGLYTFICVTVLINTLIAMMEETIDTIDDRADVEWKFARSRLYMEYIRDGNTLPVPLNICPTPKSCVYLMKRMKRMIFPDKSLTADVERANRNREDRLDGLNIRRGGINTANNLNVHSTQHDKFKNKRIFDRQRSYVLHEKLTYRIVVERIVKRFLLYYKNKRIGMDENNDGLEFKELKNDISSFRFELLNEVDVLDESRLTLIELMKTFNDDLEQHFDIKQLKTFLNEQNT